MAADCKGDHEAILLHSGHLRILALKCKDLDAKWDTLGLALGLPQPRLNAIGSKYAHVTPQSCMTTMLQEWHDASGPGATWQVLHQAALDIEKKPVARKIKQHVSDLNDEVDITDIDNIMTLLAPVVPMWSEFGLQMGIDSDILDSYGAPRQLNRCLRDTIQLWMDTKDCEETTFGSLLSAISGTLVANKALADRLRKDQELLRKIAESDQVQSSKSTTTVQKKGDPNIITRNDIGATVSAMIKCGFRVNTHWETLLSNIGLTQDELVGLRRHSMFYGVESALRDGLDKVIQRRGGFTRAQLIAAVKNIEPVTAGELNTWFTTHA